jgi:methionyl-tRNA formyltransferase
MKFTICASGHLGFVVLKELVQHQVSVSFVLTDSHSDSILAYCEAQHIPCFKGNPRKGKFLEWMKAEGLYIQHLLSINYLFILDGEILNQVEGYAINFHGSLLPKYRGRTPHVWAIINGEKECGITAHLMNDRCDDGDIVKQLVLPIEEEDTGAKILEKYNAMYPSLVMEVVRMVQSGQVTCTPQDSSKATYFSKRTPADGEINWNWQKERIRNWVRAQAAPYPGAFTFYKGHKVTVHQVKAVDEGFMDTMPNGLILSLKEGHPIVKTPNGALLLTEYLCDIQFDEKELFSKKSVDIQIDKANSGG